VGITKVTSYYTTGADDETYTFTDTHTSSASAGFSVVPVASPKNLGCSGAAFCGNPINAATGNKFQVETDYVGGANTQVEFRRYYNSMGTLGSSAVGQMWHNTYDRSVQNIQGRSYALVTRADGRIDQFRLQNSTWIPDADVTSTLTGLPSGGIQTFWQVVTADDTTEIYNLAGQLLSITTRAGLTTTLAYNGGNQLATVTGPFGHTLTFSYNTTGQINQMTVPDGGVYAYAYDSNGNLSAVTYPDTTVRQYVYENTSFSNALTGIIDELGNRFATYAYDSEGRATSTQHAGGAELTKVTYNSNGSANVTDARANVHSYSFQTQFGVVKPTAVTGAPVQSSGGKAFTFDPNGFMASRTDWDGNVTTYTHDSRGDETSRVEASGTALARTITTAWLSNFHLPTTITEPNRTTTFTYDTHGNVLTKAVTAAGVSRTWVYTYNTSGQVLTATLRRTDLSDTTKYSYDSKGDLATITDPLGHVTSITAYDANGRPLTIVDPNGLVTMLAYDPRGRLLSRTVGTEVTSYTYDAAGNPTKITLPDASFLSYSYDQAHRLAGVTDALGNSIAYTLDATDNRTLEQAFDPSNNLTRTRSYAYDLVNRLIQETGAQGQVTAYAYDTQGNLTKITDPLNHATSYAYDALNRIANALDPNNGATAYGYNANDDLVSVTDPRGLNTAYAFDGLDDQSSLTSPDTGKTSRTFDPAGNVSVSTDARGDRTIYAHDALNRQTKATFADGKIVVRNYDQGINGIGHLTTMTDATGTTTWSYDQHGRVLQRKQQTSGITLTTIYSYDAAGRRATITYPSGKQIAFSYDNDGQISGLTVNGQPVVASATYLPFGIATGWTQSNGNAYSRTIDQDGRITGIGFGGTAIGLTYDNANRIIGIAETGQTTRTATYDPLDRLTSYAVGTAATNYGYDPDGNRLSSTTATGTTNYAYSANSNRLAGLSGLVNTADVYDTDGNLTSDGPNSYSYDARGRLVQATAAALTTQYGINGLGQRASKSGAGISTGANEFVYDSGHLIGEYDATGNPIEETVWFDNTPVAVLTGVGGAALVYAVSADWLGAPHVISNSIGTPVWIWDHLAFGDNAPNQNPSGFGSFVYNLRFPGQYADAETGLNYNMARDYNPAIGRYVESDPVGLIAGANSYQYGFGNALVYADRTGEFVNVPGIVFGGVTGGIAGYIAGSANGRGVAGGLIGAGIGAVVGGAVGEFAPTASAAVGGGVAGALTFTAVNLIGTVAGTVTTNLALGNAPTNELGTALAIGLFSPLLSFEAPLALPSQRRQKNPCLRASMTDERAEWSYMKEVLASSDPARML
jgi:RHS repeat-associated protein